MNSAIELIKSQHLNRNFNCLSLNQVVNLIMLTDDN
jgi:hypothetical protein